MILQALKEYYDRKAADPDSGIAPEGWEWKEIPFIVVLKNNGDFSIESTREGEGKNKTFKKFLVPKGEKKTSGIKANLLWDTANYVLGLGDKGKEQKEAFIKRIENTIPKSEKRDILLNFLSDIPLDKISDIEIKDTVSFKFENENKLYCESKEIKNILNVSTTKKEVDGLCLISGEQDKIAILHTAIKGIWGGQTSGTNIVSFNQDSFSSYGKRKTQGRNSPIGETAMNAYTTALNTLLDKGSKQRLQIGDASTIFWSEKQTDFENGFSAYFSEPPKDNPDANTQIIKTLMESPVTGAFVEDNSQTKFYVLGLSPNAARASVRFWKVGTVAEFAANIRQHFLDLEIVKHENEPKYYSLWRLLVNAAILDKSENIPPNVAGDFMRSIIEGTPYPATILQLVLRRIKSDGGNVKPVRAAFVKAYLNRYMRKNKSHEKELTMELDTGQMSTGYLLGRLFAVLEKIQEEANPGLNVTIRERYYGTACGSPVTVFPTLMRLKNHHIAKLENKGRAVNFEKLIGEIIKPSFNDFPAHLNLHEQGKFAIGYYHQRQEFFTKKSEKENSNE